MNSGKYTAITVQTSVKAPKELVWKYFTEPEHIVNWYHASDDWHTPKATNDLQVGGKFNFRMEAKDGSFGFDFEGVYEQIISNELIEYSLADDRKVIIEISSVADITIVTETFDTETENPVKVQRSGWQAILDNFKKYTEANK